MCGARFTIALRGQKVPVVSRRAVLATIHSDDFVSVDAVVTINCCAPEPACGIAIEETIVKVIADFYRVGDPQAQAGITARAGGPAHPCHAHQDEKADHVCRDCPPHLP